MVDAGRMKEKRFDPNKNMESLDTVWVSRANAIQRKGRAGRVRPGVAFHLYTGHFTILCQIKVHSIFALPRRFSFQTPLPPRPCARDPERSPGENGLAHQDPPIFHLQVGRVDHVEPSGATVPRLRIVRRLPTAGGRGSLLRQRPHPARLPPRAAAGV